MRTKIIIEHDTKTDLKADPIWAEIMRLFLSGESVSVIEISADEDEDE